MSKGKAIAFWIIFPIVSLLISLLLVFYLDLANGPLALLIIEIIVLAGAIVARIILRHKKFVFRMIPILSVIAVNVIILPLAKPAVEIKSAAYYDNPTKTEVMELANGKVQGIYNRDKKVQIYAGIPYAKAPIGDLRWKEPQDVDNWTDVRDCSYFGPQSMQPTSSALQGSVIDIYSSKGWYPDYQMHPEQNMSEDSLYLNIWRPNNDAKDLPILVYIHGGSLTNGSSTGEDINGEEMAKTGVIMITIQYRLSVFGYFAHESLATESENHTTGNYGLLDQIKALEWINKNASYFGGDKNNITVAGESAGSSSVSAICTSPLAKGLFKRAIGESSSLIVKKAPHTFREMKDALDTGNKIMEEFNCRTIDELRKIPADQLVNTKYSNSGMTLDGYALTKYPYQVYQDKENNEEALLNGYNVLEADAFVIPEFLFSPTNKDNIAERLKRTFGEETTQKIVELYKDKIDEDAFSVYNEIFSVYWFINPHHTWSNIALENGEAVYRYQFTKDNHYHGTYHSGEMIYCYGNVKNSPHTYRYDESDVELSNKMLLYWSNFAKNGDPNGEGLENWPLYQSGGQIMELGSHVGTIDDRYLKLYQILDEFIDKVIAEQK